MGEQRWGSSARVPRRDGALRSLAGACVRGREHRPGAAQLVRVLEDEVVVLRCQEDSVRGVNTRAGVSVRA